MKKLFLLTLLALAQLSTYGQTFSITLPDTLAGKEWVRNLVREELKKVGTTPTTPEVTDPALDPCKAGPEIKEISNVSSTYLNVRFHGDGVIKLNWKILNSAGIAVRSGEISPKNNTPGITYNTLEAGKYTLILSGASCKSDLSHLPFTIAGSVGVVTPPTDTKLAVIAKGMDEHMQLVWTKIADGYSVSDLATVDLRDGYQWRYLINGEVVKTGRSTLKDYLISGINPGRILKYSLKNGLETLNHWTDRPDQHGGYYDINASQGFSHNTSYTFQTYAFPGASSSFVNPIPAWYDPTIQNVQWADHAPDMQLPKGHVWIENPSLWGIEHVMRKGVTHISNYRLPWDVDGNKEVIRMMNAGITYNDVPRLEHFLGLKKVGENDYSNGWNKAWWPTGPFNREQSIAAANQTDISHAMWIGEAEENEAFMYNNVEMWFHFYKRLRERYDERFASRGIKYYIAHNYYHLWPSEYNLGSGLSREHYKQVLSVPADKMPTSVYSPGGTLSFTNLIVEGVYLNTPDIQIDQPLNLLYHMTAAEHLGYDAGVFLAGVHEDRPNNRQEVTYPEGKYYLQNKMPLAPQLHLTNGFFAQVFGKLFVEWGGSGKTLAKKIDTEWAQGLWYPNGSKDPQGGFPYAKKWGEETFFGYTGSTDLSYFSQKLYVDTYAAVDGGKDQYLKFRIDNGKWITPSEHDFVDAYFDKRGITHSRTLNGKTAIFYLNCFADSKSHKLEIELPDGRILVEQVAGSGIHAKLL